MKRKDFKIFKDQVYLLSQGGAPIPNSLISKINKSLIELSLNGCEIHPKWDKKVESTRKHFAKSINGKAKNAAFIPSTSYAMNALAYTFNKELGSVLTFEDDFPNSSLPWINTGYKVDFIPSEENGFISTESIEKKIKKDTKILITSHVMYRTGFRQDLQKIGNLCKEKNIHFIVDATQSYGLFPIDVNNCNIDVLMFNGYKWLNAGYGIGGMYLSEAILQNYKKPFLGYTSVNYQGVKEHDTLNCKTKSEASAYELGTTSYINIFMLRHMLKFIKGIGWGKVNQKVVGLVAFCLEECKKNNIVTLSNFPKDNLSSILNISAYGITKELLKSEGITARSNGEKITIGIHYYNTKEDILKLISVIKKHK